MTLSERENLLSGLKRCLDKLSDEQLKRVLWYINCIWR